MDILTPSKGSLLAVPTLPDARYCALTRQPEITQRQVINIDFDIRVNCRTKMDDAGNGFQIKGMAGNVSVRIALKLGRKVLAGMKCKGK